MAENVIYFLVGKKRFEISALYLIPLFYKNANNFASKHKELSSFISPNLKSIVTINLLRKMLVKSTSKCYANTFVKVLTHFLLSERVFFTQSFLSN